MANFQPCDSSNLDACKINTVCLSDGQGERTRRPNVDGDELTIVCLTSCALCESVCTFTHQTKPLTIHKIHFFCKNQKIFVEARCSYSKMIKISNFAHTLPLFYAFKMLFRMSTFIYNNSMIRNLASSCVTSPDGRKSEPSCTYKGCSYIKKV